VRSTLYAAILAAAIGVVSAGVRLELRGQIDPPASHARVNLDGIDAAFSASTLTGSDGRFRFRKVPNGNYVVTVLVPGSGLVRRSVDVTPGLADARGRIEAIIPCSDGLSNTRARQLRNTVSVRELAIPDEARREFGAAQKALSKRDTSVAQTHLRRAVELAPFYAIAWLQLGAIAYRSTDWAESETCFRKALEIRPGSLISTLNLGGVLLYRGKYNEALFYNRAAVDKSPEHALANFQLGMTYRMLEQDENALKYLNKAKSLDPANYSSPQLALADIHERRGDRAAAVRELEDFLARHPDAENAALVRAQISRLNQ
jgi:tetratricopeptide (TPR) repeat protein